MLKISLGVIIRSLLPLLSLRLLVFVLAVVAATGSVASSLALLVLLFVLFQALALSLMPLLLLLLEILLTLLMLLLSLQLLLLSITAAIAVVIAATVVKLISWLKCHSLDRPRRGKSFYMSDVANDLSVLMLLVAQMETLPIRRAGCVVLLQLVWLVYELVVLCCGDTSTVEIRRCSGDVEAIGPWLSSCRVQYRKECLLISQLPTVNSSAYFQKTVPHDFKA